MDDIEDAQRKSESDLGLPGEVWSLTWKFLPLSSVVAVTHVCRAWRAMALGDPSIWPTNVSTGDGRSGVCDVCATHPGSTYSSAWEFVCAILARSSPLPLSFTSHACAEHIEGPVSRLLKEVSARLTDVHISGSGDLLGHVLPALHLAPSLRSVSLRGNNMDTFYLVPDVDIPVLEHLDLDLCPGIIQLPSADAHASRLYSKLRVASFVLGDLAQVLTMPGTCPNVLDVTVNVPGRLHCTGFVKPAGFARYPAVLNLRSLIPDGFIIGPNVMAALRDNFLPDVTLDFGNRSFTPEEEILPFFEPIHNAGTIVLTATRVAGTYQTILVAVEAQTRVRRAIVAGHRCLMMMHQIHSIGAYIPAHMLVSATVDLVMWWQFTGISFIQRTYFPSLSALTVIIVPLIDRQPDQMMSIHCCPPTSATFPVLATLRIERMADPAGNQLLPSEWLSDFVELMDLDHFLQKIELPGCTPQTLEQVRRLRLAEHVE